MTMEKYIHSERPCMRITANINTLPLGGNPLGWHTFKKVPNIING